MGLPFLPFRGLIETDSLRLHPEWKVAPNPFDPSEDVLLIPATVPNVAVFHAARADRFGNVLAPATGDTRLVAQAAERTIVTAEEVVDYSLLDEVDRSALIAGLYVTAVVHAPFGAHPGGCLGRYQADAAHLAGYIAAGKSEAGFRNYVQTNILDTRDEARYREQFSLSLIKGAAPSPGPSLKGRGESFSSHQSAQ